MKTRRAFTLIEILVVMFMMMLVFTSILDLFFLTNRFDASSSKRTDTAESLGRVCWRVLLELRDSSVPLVTTNATPAALSFSSAYDNNSLFVTDAVKGTATWQKYIVYYIPAGSTDLRRRELPGPASTALTPAQLSAACDGTGRIVTTGVSGMTLTTAVPTSSATLSLTWSSTDNAHRLDTQAVSLTIQVRN